MTNTIIQKYEVELIIFRAWNKPIYSIYLSRHDLEIERSDDKADPLDCVKLDNKRDAFF